MIKPFRLNNSQFFQTLDDDFVQNAPVHHWFALLWYLTKYYRYFFITMVVTAFISLNELIVINKLTENFALLCGLSPKREVFIQLFKDFALFTVLYCCLEISARFRDYVFSFTIPSFEGTVRILLETLALQQPYETFIGHTDGEIATKIQEVADGISDIFEIIAMYIMPYCLFLLSCLYLLYRVSVPYLWVLLSYILLIVVVFRMLYGPLGQNAKESYSAQNHLSKILVDIFANIFIIKSFKVYQQESKFFAKNQLEETSLYNKFLTRLSTVKFYFLMLHLLFFVVIGNCVLLHQWYHRVLQPSQIVFLFLIGSYCGWIVVNFFQKLLEIFTAIGQCEASLNVFNHRKTLIGCNPTSCEVLKTGNIEFKNVNYRGILKNINLKISDGSKVGIIGPSGSGKSTLVSLLLKIIDNDGGDILIDGENIKDINEETIKNTIGIITQDNLIFDRTIEENITLGENFKKKDIMESVQQAQLEDVVKSKEEGIEFAVGNKGRRLSGGQKQRLNIARVFIRHPKIIICDEASSALDSKNEKIIMDNLINTYKDNTIFFITHNINTTVDLDYVIVLEAGAVVEFDTPKHLIEKKGLYFEYLKGYVGE